MTTVKTNIKMLTIQEYLSQVFEVVRINAQLQEIRRISVCFPPSSIVADREDDLYKKRDKILAKLDKSHKPIEIAPVEQYIDLEYRPVK